VQASNWILVPVAAITAVWGIEGATLPAAMMSAGAVLTALAGWAFVIRENPRDETRTNVPKLWGEALSLVTIMTAGSVFLQLERLVIPFVLGIEELARFGVLAALVGSPFRMIQAAVMFTVVPAMREAKTVVDRRRLLQRELLMAASVTACISIVMWPAVPYLAHWLLAGRYDLSAALMGATLVSGAFKVLSAFSTATATALAPEKGLRLLSVGCWASLGVATLGGLAGASWGLTGVIYGICIGWIARWLIATWISIPHLRHSTDATSCV